MIFNCTAPSKASEFHKLTSLNNCLTAIKQWLHTNYLQLNPDKTETLIIAPDDCIPQIKQHIGVLRWSVLPKIRNLGIVFDSAMSMHLNAKLVAKKTVSST